jgi:choline dehydrogenase-like flavoprotein
MLASTGVEAGAFLRTSPELPRTDLQLTFLAGKRGAKLITYGHGYGMVAINLRPWGRGEVKLTSRSPRAAPAIDPRFFADERDLDVVVAGMRVARRILNAAPFERYGGVEVLPGPQVNSDDEIRDFIRRNSLTAFHPVGTCAMGAGPDAVVDAGLNVHGMKGLRVVDASIMPVIVGGNTNAPTIMIAEKAADMILERAPLSPAELPIAAGRAPARGTRPAGGVKARPGSFSSG